MPFCITDSFGEYMSAHTYTDDEMLLIVKSTLEKVKAKPESFLLGAGSDYKTVRDVGENVSIRVYSEHITVELLNLSGRHRFGFFNPITWKMRKAAAEIISILENKDEAVHRVHRLQKIYKYFPELITQEFEKEVLNGK